MGGLSCRLLLLRFNPTLVRLRPCVDVSCACTQTQFQSHAGSIEAQSLVWAGGGGARVSIPRWFD